MTDPLSWSVDLWDQVDAVLKYKASQLEILDQCYKPLLELNKQQIEFRKKSRKILESFQPKSKSNLGDTTFLHVINEFWTSLFDSLQVTSSSSASNPAPPPSPSQLEQLVIDFKKLIDTQTKIYQTSCSAWLQAKSEYEARRKHLTSVWKSYVQAYKEHQKASANFIKADNNNTLSRLEIQKFDDIRKVKYGLLQVALQQYSSTLSSFESTSREFYGKRLPNLLEDLESAHCEQGAALSALLTNYTSSDLLHLQHLVEANKSTHDMIDRQLDSCKDAWSIAVQLQSSRYPPPNPPLLNLTTCPESLLAGPSTNLGLYLLEIDRVDAGVDQLLISSDASSAKTSSRRGTMARTDSHDQSSASVGDNLRSPFVCGIGQRGLRINEMTNQQLASVIREYHRHSIHASEVSGGLERLIDTYTDNPAHGSASAIRPKLMTVQLRLSALNARLETLRSVYNSRPQKTESRPKSLDTFDSDNDSDFTDDDVVDNDLPPPPPLVLMSGIQDLHVSDSSSLDGRSTGNNNGHYHPSSVTSDIVSNGGAVNHNDSPTPSTSFSSDELYYAVGVVKYEYAGDGGLYLAGQPGQMFHITHPDDNETGWIYVVSEDKSQEGYFPTSFLDIKPLSNSRAS